MSPEFLTQEGFNKLEEELEYLRTVKRKEVAARLHEAAESSLGEFVEDPEFEAAKNEQSFVEGRIRERTALGDLARRSIVRRREVAEDQLLALLRRGLGRLPVEEPRGLLQEGRGELGLQCLLG